MGPYTSGCSRGGERAAETNRAGPLRRIAGVERFAGFWGWFEVLECGHRGKQHSTEAHARFWLRQGRRRRRPDCGSAES